MEASSNALGFKRAVHIPLTHCVLTVLLYRTRMKTLLCTHLHNIKKGQALEILWFAADPAQPSWAGVGAFMKQALTQCLPWKQACKHSGQSH